MNYIVEFYKELDTINLIIFWGVIIVVLLLLIFSIIIVNKNKKLERIIEKNGIDIDEDNISDELPIKRNDELPIVDKIENEETPVPVHVAEREKVSTINDENIKKEVEVPIVNHEESVKEKKFVAEEYVKEYNNDFFTIPNIKKQTEQKEIITEQKKEENLLKENESNKNIEMDDVRPSRPYQKNILHEVYPSQTSPIGNSLRAYEHKKEIVEAKELNSVLNNENRTSNEIIDEKKYNQIKTNNLNNKGISNNIDKIQQRAYQDVPKKGNYLEELSKKMSQNNNDNNINRTAYELQQEEDAIISYRELMQKKDSIKTIDEEEAIISIEELNKRRIEKEKLYNITEKEADDDFINELKNFRSDL